MNPKKLAQIPVTEEEAFKILDKVYTLREKEAAIDMDRSEFSSEEHFGLGLWIRNHWVYRPESNDPAVLERYEKCFEMLTGVQHGDPIYFHPDSVSGDFLEKYYDHLQEFVASRNEPVSVSRKPAKCPHCGGKVVLLVYGDPTPEVMDAAEHGKVILGGCCIALDSPDFACAVCGQRFKKEI